jgi:hypothetical protein
MAMQFNHAVNLFTGDSSKENGNFAYRRKTPTDQLNAIFFDEPLSRLPTPKVANLYFSPWKAPEAQRLKLARSVCVTGQSSALICFIELTIAEEASARAFAFVVGRIKWTFLDDLLRKHW